MRLDEGGEGFETEVDTHVDGGRHGRAQAFFSRPSVDPARRKPRPACLHMVVKDALGGVQDVGLGDALGDQMFDQIGEIARVRLVRADILGGVDPVEFDAEPGVAGPEALPIDVGEDYQLVVPIEVS